MAAVAIGLAGPVMAVLAALVPWPAVRVEAVAQTPGRSARDGIFTAEQAARGKPQFLEHCSMCHGEELEGGLYNGCEVAALKRPDFMAAGDVATLFARVRMRMPFDNPGSLPEATYADIFAFLMQQNGYPSGATEFSPRPEQQAGLRFSKAGAVRTGALVQVVGCLSRKGTDWVLTNGSEPAATDRGTATPADLKDAEAQALGAGTFRLLSLSANPDALAGHKVEARGLLIQGRDDNRINVTSLETVAATCSQ